MESYDTASAVAALFIGIFIFMGVICAIIGETIKWFKSRKKNTLKIDP